jgi:hypothetical protein
VSTSIPFMAKLDLQKNLFLLIAKTLFSFISFLEFGFDMCGRMMSVMISH